MEIIGLIDSINKSAISIDSGRKGFAIIGKERERRINYESGIALAMETFKEAQATSDPQIILLAEYTFITQELEFCEKSDKDAINSLSRGIRFFDDAFLAVKAIEKPDYKIADDLSCPRCKIPHKRLPIGLISHRYRRPQGTIAEHTQNPRTRPDRKSLIKTAA